MMIRFGVSYSGESGGSGSSLKTSSTAPPIQPRLERAAQGQLVDQPAAGDVDQPGALAHRPAAGRRRSCRPSRRSAARPPPRCRCRRSSSSSWSKPKQLDVGAPPRPRSGWRRVARMRRPERLEQARDLGADAAVADDPDRQAAQLAAAQRLPGPLALQLEQLRQAAGDGQAHHHHVLGDRPAEDAAGVRDRSGRARGRRAWRRGRPRPRTSGSSPAAVRDR